MVVKYLVMNFKAQSGDKISLTVNGVRDDVTREDVEEAMDVIIAKDAFVTKGGSLKEKLGAQIITKNVDEFELG